MTQVYNLSDALEPYYTPGELATILKLAPSKVRELFQNAPGVIVIPAPSRPGRRPYKTIRIPQSAVDALKVRSA